MTKGPFQDDDGRWYVVTGAATFGAGRQEGKPVYPDDPRYWRRLAKLVDPHRDDLIVLGFDGSKGRAKGVADSTALASIRLTPEDSARKLETVELWEDDGPGWEPPRREIDELVTNLVASGRVVGMRGDPAGGWGGQLNEWQARFAGVFWNKNVPIVGTWSQKSFEYLRDDIAARQLYVDKTDTRMLTHLAAARDHDGHVEKAHRGPEAQKMDLAAAAAYANRALHDALAARLVEEKRRSRSTSPAF